MDAPRLSIERYAVVSAHVAHFASRHADRPDGTSGRASLEQVLDRLGVTRGDYDAAKSHWTALLRVELDDGETTHSLAMADPFQTTQAELRRTRPRIEDVAPLDPPDARAPGAPPARVVTPPSVTPPPPVVTPPSVTPPPPVVTPPPAAPPSIVMNPAAATVDKPSFLQAPTDPRPAPSFVAVAPPPSVRAPAPSRGAITTDEIPAISRSSANTEGRSASPLPFVPSAIAAPPVRSKEREDMVPIGMRGFTSLTGTQGPIATPRGPAMPFAFPDARATEALPLERYATVTAALASGEARADVLARHGLTDERWHTLVGAWGERFEREPELMTQFREALARIRAVPRR